MVNKNKIWTVEDLDFLLSNYSNNGKLYCAEKLNRTEGSIRYKAAKLKLSLNKNSDFFIEFQKRAAQSKVGKKRPEHSILMREYELQGRLNSMRNKTKEEREKYRLLTVDWHKKNEHPRGMLGKTHSEENKKKQSEYFKKMWANPKSIVNSKKHRQNISDRMSLIQSSGVMSNRYSRCKKGTIEIGGKSFFARSSWEANIGAYFQLLKDKKEILDWVHEPQTFWFLKIQRGVRSYKPDFLITRNDGTTYFEEVKGYMDPKSITKLRRMKKYYPEITVGCFRVKKIQ